MPSEPARSKHSNEDGYISSEAGTACVTDRASTWGNQRERTNISMTDDVKSDPMD